MIILKLVTSTINRVNYLVAGQVVMNFLTQFFNVTIYGSVANNSIIVID